MTKAKNGFDSTKMSQISDLLIKGGYTVAIAESVTAGQLQTAFSMADQALQFFQGGITVYNLGQKTRHLNVDPVHAAACNCVSETVAAQMAKNVSELFLSDWGIGVTGYASPVPEKGIHSLFACFAFYFRGKEIDRQTVTTGNNSPAKVRDLYIDQILNQFLKSFNKIKKQNA